MPIPLLPLPFEIDALEPHISAETLLLHHGKHHKAYVDKLNAAIKETDYEGQPLEDIVRASAQSGDVEVFHNAAQTWNHGFYWNCLTGAKSAAPPASLLEAINKKFGTLDALIAEFESQGEKHFGSGWTWLVIEDGALAVTTTHDAGTPLAEIPGMIPLLTIDVWEHAYYVDWKNERPKYLTSVLKNLINWQFVSDNFERQTVWQYDRVRLYA
ncbi:MAG: superoxide dismutase [Novosphingobium sp.]